jgi:hypothetical protein
MCAFDPSKGTGQQSFLSDKDPEFLPFLRDLMRMVEAGDEGGLETRINHHVVASFREWAKEHQESMHSSPTLQKLQRRIERFADKGTSQPGWMQGAGRALSGAKKVIASTFSSAAAAAQQGDEHRRAFERALVENSFQSGNEVINSFFRSAKLQSMDEIRLLFGHLSLGTVEEKWIQNIITHVENPNILKHRAYVRELFSLLATLQSENVMKTLISIHRHFKISYLHDADALDLILPLLAKLEPAHFVQLVRETPVKDFAHCHPDFFSKLYPLIESLSGTLLVQLMRGSPIQNPDVLASALPLFDRLSNDEIFALFKDGNILSTDEIFGMCIPLLQKLSDALGTLLVDDKMKTLTADTLCHFFNSLENAVVIELLKKRNLLRLPNVSSAIIHLIPEKFTLDEVMQGILDAPYSGVHLIENPKIISHLKALAGGSILPLFNYDRLVVLVNGETTFDSLMNEIALLPAEDMKQALKHRLSDGTSLIHSKSMLHWQEIKVGEYQDSDYGHWVDRMERRVVKNRLHPIFSKLSLDDQKELLMHPDHEGKCFIHLIPNVEGYGQYFSKASSLLSFEDCMQIERQSHLAGKKYSCYLIQNRLAETMQLQSIQALDPEDLLLLLYGFNVNGGDAYQTYQDCLNKKELTLDWIKTQLISGRWYTPFLIKVLRPILERLDFEPLCEVLSSQDKQGMTPLFYVDAFTMLYPHLLKKGLSDENFSIIKHSDTKMLFKGRDFLKTRLIRLLKIQNASGNICLHNISIFQTMIPFLKRLDSLSLYNLIYLKNQSQISLFKCQKLKDRMALYHRLEDPELLAELQEINSENNRMLIENLLIDTQKSSSFTVDELLPFLQRLPNPLKLKLLWNEDYVFERKHYREERTCWFVNNQVFNAMSSSLDTLTQEEICDKLFRTISTGYIPLAYINMAPKIAEVMKSRSRADIVSFLSLVAKNISKVNQSAFAPLFQALEPHELLAVLSHQSEAHVIQTLSLIAPSIFDKFSEEQIDEFLSLQYEQNHFYYASDRYMPIRALITDDMLISLLNKLPLGSLLSQIERSRTHKSILENQRVFTSIASKLASCDVDSLITLVDGVTSAGVPLCHTFILHALLPHLQEVDKNTLLLIAIQKKDSQGEILLHKSSLLPLLDHLDLSLDKIKVLLKSENSSKQTPLHKPECLQLLRPLLEKMDSRELADLLTQQDNNGCGPLHILNDANVSTTFLEMLSADDYIRVFSLRNSLGNLARLKFHPDHIKSFTREQLLSFLQLTHLHYLNSGLVIDCLADSISKLCHLHDIDRLFGQQLSNGYKVFDKPELMLPFIKLVKKMDGDVLQYLAKNDRSRRPCIHNTDICRAVLPELEKMDPNLALDALLIRDTMGNAALHNRNILSFAKPLVDRLGYDLSSCVNLSKLSPNDKVTFLDSWLKQFKVRGGVTAPIQDREYNTRITQAEKYILNTFDNLHFAKEDGINPEFLFTQDERPEFTKEVIDRQKAAVREALVDILGKMKVRRVWLGTPEASDPRGLAMFYSEMLINLENVIEYIKVQEDKVKAGTLVQMAAVKLEGRCAAAYQAEIRQRAECCLMSMGRSNMTLEDIIQGALNKGLINVVDSVVRGYSRSIDSHILTRFMFSVGLAMNDDPLCQSISIDEAYALIASRMDFDEFFKQFEKDLPSEYIEEYFRKTIPQDYDFAFNLADGTRSSYKDLTQKTQEQERLLQEKLKTSFKAIGSDGETLSQLLKFFENYRNSSINALLELTFVASSLQEMAKKYAERELQAFAKRELPPLQRRLQEGNLKARIEKIQEACDLLEKKMHEMGISSQGQVKILEAFIRYQQSLIAFSEKFPEDSYEEGAECLYFSFDLVSQNLPSQSVKKSCELKFLESLDNLQIKKRSLLERFKVIDVTRSKCIAVG